MGGEGELVMLGTRPVVLIIGIIITTTTTTTTPCSLNTAKCAMSAASGDRTGGGRSRIVAMATEELDDGPVSEVNRKRF